MLCGVLFPVLQVFGIPNSPRSLDLDDRQGFIASSAMQQKKITLDEAEPYGVYFFQSSMLRVLTREGIRPKKKSQPGRSSLLKVQPTDNPGPVGSEEDVRGDRGLSVFRLRAVSRLTLVVRCTEISYSVSTQVLGFRFGCGWCCVVGFLFGCCWFCGLLLCVSAWWNRGILDEVTKASYGRAVTGTAVMARSANEEKKKTLARLALPNFAAAPMRAF